MGDASSLVECLPSMHEVLSLTFSTLELIGSVQCPGHTEDHVKVLLSVCAASSRSDRELQSLQVQTKACLL